SGGLTLPLMWALTILLFFSFSTRLEYYTLPALPALALLAGRQCAVLWERGGRWPSALLGSLGALIGVMLFGIAASVSSAAADAGFRIFAPRLTSKPIATEINRRLDAGSIIVIDGEYEEGCSIGFYTEHTVLIHNPPSSNLEYGSRFADAPPLFVDDERLRE